MSLHVMHAQLVHKFAVLKLGGKTWEVVFNMVEQGDAYLLQNQIVEHVR